MIKRIIVLLVCVMLMLCGCSQEQPEDTVLPTVAEPQPVSVTENIVVDEKELVIDVSVEVPDLTAMEEIHLVFDEDLLNTMVKELVHSQYPGLEEGTMDGYRTWSVSTPEKLQFSFHCADNSFEAGWNYYLDVTKDLNGQDIGDDEQMRRTPYYLTPNIPDKLNMTAEEAGKVMAEFLEKYSCFDYEPWNIVGVNCRSDADSSGYYQATMQPQYDGRQVLIEDVPRVSMCLSAEGVFTFQGVMILKEKDRSPAEITVTLEDAVAQFMEDYPEIASWDKVTVEKISAGYVAQSHFDGTRVLSPAWIFEYATSTADGEYTFYHTIAYRMKDGSLFD